MDHHLGLTDFLLWGRVLRICRLKSMFGQVAQSILMTSRTLISTLLQVVNVYIRNIKRHVGIINPEMLFPNESMPNCDFDTRPSSEEKLAS